MSFYNLANWISSDSDVVISRNSGIALAQEFGGVYIETATGAGNEINEALSACLNLYINNAVFAQDVETGRRSIWYGAVCLSRPARYALRGGLVSTRNAVAGGFNRVTRG